MVGFRVLFWVLMLCVATPAAWAQPNDVAEINLANEYYNDGEYERALELYQKLYRRQQGTDLFVYRIVDCHLQLGNAPVALEFVNEVVRRNQGRPHFEALKGRVMQEVEGPPAAEAFWIKLIDERLGSLQDFSLTGSYFTQNRLYPQAIQTYERARVKLRDPAAFASELATLYTVAGRTADAVGEYVGMFLRVPGQFAVVKTSLMRLVRDENRAEIERKLLAMQTEHPQNVQLLEMLYEFYLGSKEYREALAQARALDLRNHENGSRLYSLGQTLQANTEYDLSTEAFQMVVQYNTNSPYFLPSYLEIAKNFELKAFSRKPLDTTLVRQAVQNYDGLFREYGRLPSLAEAMHRKARLCVFYLNDQEAALAELRIIEQLNIVPLQKAESALLLGDIYLMRADYLAAQRQYDQVEEQFREAQVGAMARFRGARLNFFRGEFTLAQARLKILKDNTSNDIANDAIHLFLTIQDNIGLDSSTYPLERFAAAQLMAYQRQNTQAVALLDSIAYAFPTHPLADDILWEKAKIILDQGQIEEGIALLQSIVDRHDSGVLADDALFTLAELYHYSLNNTPKAQQLYLDLLMKFPSSLYKVEARKRIRQLRGDRL